MNKNEATLKKKKKTKIKPAKSQRNKKRYKNILLNILLLLKR